MRKHPKVFMSILFLTAVFVGIFQDVMAATPEQVAANIEKFSFFTLIPPVIAIVLAFLTKNVIASLFIGVFSGTFMLELSGINIIRATAYGFVRLSELLIETLSDPWNGGIILQCLAIGALIALISKMGGTKAIANSLAKRAKSRVSAQIITWMMGMIIFFDDYANSLTIGPIMKPVTDKMKISREKLAFIIDSTAAPIAGIAIISTWVAYEVGLIKDGLAEIGMEINAYGAFVSTIPFRFYNILILIFIVCTALFLREFGPMLTAERRAKNTGKVLADGAKPMLSIESKEVEPKEGIKLNVWNAIIPMGVLIFGAFIGFYLNGYSAILGGKNLQMIELVNSAPFSFTTIRETFGASDASIVLFQSAFLAGIVAIVMGLVQGIFTLGEAMDCWLAGVKSLLITAVILLLAWSLSGVIKELGTAKYFADLLSGAIPAFILPSIIFLLGSFISFSTGTSYGTMGILMPMTIPLAYAIVPEQEYIIMNIGAVLTGSIFGDHCSPISDTTILSSMGSSCDHIDHTKTQMVYAITVAGISVLFGYIPVGLGVPVYIVLPVATVAVILTVRIFGKLVNAPVNS